ncbi:MAG: type II secretion system F family protein [Candidatus Omnitrophica bacterium]|nr:type II secretion system F family protein [Candidatus Omnitrophota bacterium]
MKYFYKAKKNTGETVTGEISAQSHDEAVELIHQLGLVPVHIVPNEALTEIKDKKQRISSKELYVFTRQLSNLLKAGISLMRALQIIADQNDDNSLKWMLQDIIKNIKNGLSFSECLTHYPNIFSSLYIALVHAGEESGNLKEVSQNIAQYLKKQLEVISKVKTAFAYPTLMAVVGAATVYFVLTFVLPRMIGVFESVGQTLPFPTLILVNVSRFLSNIYVFISVFVFFLFITIKQWQSYRQNKYVWLSRLIPLPMVRSLLLKIDLARFARTLMLLMRGGISLTDSLQMAAGVLHHTKIKQKLIIVKEELVAGGSLGVNIKKVKEIPKMMGHLIAIGEESGNLNEVLGEIADIYEQETDDSIKTVTSLLEPLLILVIASFLGFIIFAMLLPIFQMDLLSF